jgi:RES domain-containing protein
MRLWRISAHADLSGDGGLLASGRWHRRGRRIVYLTDHPASALVEVLVHLEVDPEDLPENYRLLGIDIPDDVAFHPIEVDEFAEWRDIPDFTETLGEFWLNLNHTALARVPSAIVPATVNWLLNPAHPEAAKARIAEAIPVAFDRRLFRPR